MEYRSTALEKTLKFMPAGDLEGYCDCVSDLLGNETVCLMDKFVQHRYVTTLEHCLHVSVKSYEICRRLSLDYRSAARGALLHDLFLYDWHITKPYRGMHAFSHPGIALQNASACCSLNERERDIIKKHMWPLTLSIPRYKESMVVSFVDKYCALAECFRFRLSYVHASI